jgi:hypothetical protein
MSQVAVPPGYRSLQDFLLRWHSRNPQPSAAPAPAFTPPPPGDAIRVVSENFPVDHCLRCVPKHWQRKHPPQGRGSFYERRLRSDVAPSTIVTPAAADFRPLVPSRAALRPN